MESNRHQWKRGNEQTCALFAEHRQTGTERTRVEITDLIRAARDEALWKISGQRLRRRRSDENHESHGKKCEIRTGKIKVSSKLHREKNI